MTQQEAGKAVDELLSSTFFDADTRMIYVTYWFGTGWSEAEFAAIFSVEITMTGFYFSHWWFQVLDHSGASTLNVCLVMLCCIFGVQVLQEIYEIVTACILDKKRKVSLHQHNTRFVASDVGDLTCSFLLLLLLLCDHSSPHSSASSSTSPTTQQTTMAAASSITHVSAPSV